VSEKIRFLKLSLADELGQMKNPTQIEPELMYLYLFDNGDVEEGGYSEDGYSSLQTVAKRAMKRGGKLTKCECGFPGADRSHRHHRLSIYHRQHRRIWGLLSRDTLSFADIGVSSESHGKEYARSLGSLGWHRDANARNNASCINGCPLGTSEKAIVS